MHSLRTRITLLAVCLIVIAVSAVTMLSVLFIRRSERIESDQMLLLMCETGERNIDYYFDSVQKTVARVAYYADNDLKGLDDEQLREHIQHVEEYFENTAYRTNGVLTFYYRIDPEISENVKGFWYTNLTGTGFETHTVTDISAYDTGNTSELVWFTVPKSTGKAVWLPPYITENLNMRVISYNIPVYWKDTFVGVIGIELDYSSLAAQVDSIRLYSNGYAFLSDADGNLFYHPKIDVAKLDEYSDPEFSGGLFSEQSTFFSYTYKGVRKAAAWLSLSNGMRLVVSVPEEETYGDWQRLIREILVISAVVLITLSSFTLYYTGRITKPLEELTEATEQFGRGNYDFRLDYDKDDEVGRLTSSFKLLAGHLNEHINDLNKRVFVDALTSVRNKGAFTEAIEKLQGQVVQDSAGEFAIGMFDCDNLKTINDRYGHDKGDVYLKNTCHLICQVFEHSPVFRIGGDEFAVILQNEDYQNRNALIMQLNRAEEVVNSARNNQWEQIHISKGIADYDPETDKTVADTIRRADKFMYADKRRRKTEAASADA